jgi:hypothetical protein
MNSKIAELAIRMGVIPNEKQTLLLKACLLSAELSNRSFQLWLAALGIDLMQAQLQSSIGLPQVYDQLDLGSQRLLSLLYKHFSNLRISHPVVQKLSGYYKYVWYRNNLLKSRMLALVTELNAIAVESVLIKGIALIEKYYPDYGMRPTLDLDIVIHPQDIVNASDLLLSKGWKSRLGDPYQVTKSQLHAHTFYHGDIELDLHFNFSGFSLSEKTEKTFWDHATLQEQGYKILRPAHELYITILHAYQWNITAPIRWVADSTILISQFDDNEWTEFGRVFESENADVHCQAINYLFENGFVNIEGKVLDLLRRKRTNQVIDSQIIYALTSPDMSAFVTPARVWSKAKYHNKSFVNRVKALLDHYVYVWSMESYWSVLPKALLKLVDKIKN